MKTPNKRGGTGAAQQAAATRPKPSPTKSLDGPGRTST